MKELFAFIGDYPRFHTSSLSSVVLVVPAWFNWNAKSVSKAATERVARAA
jgi:hypothetical protein